MSALESTFQEANLQAKPIRDLGLKIAGTRLEPILKTFEAELQRVGIRRVHPRFYLSTEWGVPFDTVAIAIPFYLASPELTALHAERVGHIEGFNGSDILRYLRHEMGHVINYAYRLYEEAEWRKLFGAITQSYAEEYRPQPFSPRHVDHLPGWYAQKHPDEDWAETFAVWMTPGRDWRADYEDRPGALAKLAYCDRTMAAVSEREPLVTAEDLDEDVGDLPYSLEQYYQDLSWSAAGFAPGLDGAIRSICDSLGATENLAAGIAQRPASALIRRLERDLMADVFRWTGHFPERTRPLLRHLAGRADQLQLAYPEDREEAAIVALTTLVTALAMNHVYRGTYFPEADVR